MTIARVLRGSSAWAAEGIVDGLSTVKVEEYVYGAGIAFPYPQRVPCSVSAIIACGVC